jgi:hypothetical protein
MYELLRKKPYKTKAIKYKGRTLRVELADSFTKQAVGLMYREKLGKADGMLFILSSEGINRASITMLNMKFAIDIVWLDSAGCVVDIVERAPPANSIFTRPYAPKAKAKYVLELGSGQANKLKIKENEKLSL